MNDSLTTYDDEQYYDYLADEMTGYLNPGEIARRLLGITQDPNLPTPDLLDDTEALLSAAVDDDGDVALTNDLIKRVINHDSEARRVAEAWALHSAEVKVDTRRGSRRATQLEKVVANHPKRLAQKLIQRERDQQAGYTYPGDFEYDLHVEQIVARYNIEVNANERKKLWDEILSYTEYNCRATVDDDTNYEKKLWAKTEAKAHNQFLRTIERWEDRDSTEFEVDINVVPVRLRSPDIDPMDDIANFVWREQ